MYSIPNTHAPKPAIASEVVPNLMESAAIKLRGSALTTVLLCFFRHLISLLPVSRFAYFDKVKSAFVAPETVCFFDSCFIPSCHTVMV